MAIIIPPNMQHSGAANRGCSSGPMGGTPQTGRGAMPSGDRFQLPDAKMPQPPSAVEPGKGAVPVNPWDAQGRPKQSAMLPDEAPLLRAPTVK